MTPAIISALQAELRHIASNASAPLMEFLDQCEHAPEAQSECYRNLAIIVGHEAKAIARIGQLFSWLQSVEPDITEAEMIQEVIARFQKYEQSFHRIIAEHNLATPMGPFVEVVKQSILACEKALQRAGGPVPRRNLKMELQELLCETQLSTALCAPGMKNYSPELHEELFALGHVPMAVGMGELQASEAKYKLLKARHDIESARQELQLTTPDPMPKLMERIDRAVAACNQYLHVAA